MAVSTSYVISVWQRDTLRYWIHKCIDVGIMTDAHFRKYLNHIKKMGVYFSQQSKIIYVFLKNILFLTTTKMISIGRLNIHNLSL